jgi:hypothetical protein
MRAAGLLLLVLAAACSRPDRFQHTQVDPARFTIAGDKLVLRHDVVGEGKWAAMTTFVLVDVRNDHTVDSDVNVAGDLLDRSQQVVGRLRVEMLRVPAGSKRIFALVDDKNQHRPTATTARIRVVGATEATHPLSLSVEEGTVHQQGDHLIASARIFNRARRTTKAIILCGFYDADDRPMTRPFTTLQLDGDTSRAVDFQSPPGAAKGYIYIGDSVW